MQDSTSQVRPRIGAWWRSWQPSPLVARIAAGLALTLAVACLVSLAQFASSTRGQLAWALSGMLTHGIKEQQHLEVATDPDGSQWLVAGTLSVDNIDGEPNSFPVAVRRYALQRAGQQRNFESIARRFRHDAITRPSRCDPGETSCTLEWLPARGAAFYDNATVTLGFLGLSYVMVAIALTFLALVALSLLHSPMDKPGAPFRVRTRMTVLAALATLTLAHVVLLPYVTLPLVTPT